MRDALEAALAPYAGQLSWTTNAGSYDQAELLRGCSSDRPIVDAVLRNHAAMVEAGQLRVDLAELEQTCSELHQLTYQASIRGAADHCPRGDTLAGATVEAHEAATTTRAMLSAAEAEARALGEQISRWLGQLAESRGTLEQPLAVVDQAAYAGGYARELVTAAAVLQTIGGADLAERSWNAMEDRHGRYGARAVSYAT